MSKSILEKVLEKTISNLDPKRAKTIEQIFKKRKAGESITEKEQQIINDLLRGVGKEFKNYQPKQETEEIVTANTKQVPSNKENHKKLIDRFAMVASSILILFYIGMSMYFTYSMVVGVGDFFNVLTISIGGLIAVLIMLVRYLVQDNGSSVSFLEKILNRLGKS